MKQEGLSSGWLWMILFLLLKGFSLGAQDDSVVVRCYQYEGKVLQDMIGEFSKVIADGYDCESSKVLSLGVGDSLNMFYLRQFPALYVLEDSDYGTASVIRVDSFFVVFDPSRIEAIGEAEVSKDFIIGQIPTWALDREYGCLRDTVSYLDYINTWVSFVLNGDRVSLSEVHHSSKERGIEPVGLLKRIGVWFRRVF